MRSFPTSAIRNVALVGHGNSGKTTLVEGLLLVAGAIGRPGRVEDGNTVCDFEPEETQRQISVSTSLASFEWKETKLNILDTPGYADFMGDVAAALHVADLVVFVVSGVDGVEVQAEIIWHLAEERGLPRIIFVNKLDRERADFERTLEELKQHFGAGVAPLELPIGSEASFAGVTDLLSERAFTYTGDGTSAIYGVEGPVPAELEVTEHAVHDALVEGIVVADDALMERYLGDEPIETAELEHALASGIAAGTVFPVLCGSAAKLIGIDRLADVLVNEAPAPTPQDGPASAFAFKTIADPYVGRVNFLKLLSGTVRPDATLSNVRTGAHERLHSLLAMRGKDQDPLPEVHAGDLFAVTKLADARTGDVLADKAATAELAPLDTPPPTLPVAISPKAKADEDKLANALHRLEDEDPAIRVERNPETHQTILWGMGETHLAIACERLARKFGVQVERGDVRVPYRETIAAQAEAEGRYKKQTGGHGQYGVAFLRVEPLERGGGFEFIDAVVGGAIPRQFIPAVEKGIVETMSHGGAFGFPVVDVRVTCFDGKYHSVDSSEMSFRMAGSLGFKEAIAAASPTLLEPISELVVMVPESHQGDVLGDLNAKRGRIQGTASLGRGLQEISALVPTAEILRYAVDLRSLTGGRGSFTVHHSHYDPAPPHVADKIKASAAG